MSETTECQIATIQVLIQGDEPTACDTLSELLRDVEGVVDWSYLHVDRPRSPHDEGGYCTPHGCPTDLEGYQEGDAFTGERDFGDPSQ